MKALPTIILLLYIVMAGNAQSIDPNFGPNFLNPSRPRQVLTLPDGKVIVAGAFNFFNGVAVGKMLRLNADGTTDNTFNTGTGAGGGAINDIIRQPDGKLIVLGAFRQFNSQDYAYAVRLNVNGSIDPSFQADVDGEVIAAALQSTGKLVVSVAHYHEFEEEYRNQVKRLNADGSGDDLFWGYDFDFEYDEVKTIVVLPDDRLLYGGRFELYNGSFIENFARSDADGHLDIAFNQNNMFKDGVSKIFRQPNGSIFVSNIFTLVKLTADGQPDISFEPEEGINVAGGVVFFDDGSLVASGYEHLTKYSSTGEKIESIDVDYGWVWKLDNDRFLSGEVDEDPLTTAVVRKMDIGEDVASARYTIFEKDYDVTFTKHVDNKWLVKSRANYYSNGTEGDMHKMSTLVRLNPDLSFDDTFTFNALSGFDVDVDLLGVDPNGKIYTGEGIPLYLGLARHNSDGSVDGTFAPSQGEYMGVVSLPDERVVAIERSSFDTQWFLSRFNSDGSRDQGFKVTANHDILSLDLMSDGKFIVTMPERFSYIAGEEIEILARLNSDGSFDHSLGTIYTEDVTNVVALPDAQMLLSGTMKPEFGGLSYPLRLYDANGSSPWTIADGTTTGHVGLDVAVNGDEIYFLRKGPLGTAVSKVGSNGLVDTRFETLLYSNALITPLSRKHRLHVLADSSLLIVADEIYHIIVPIISGLNENEGFKESTKVYPNPARSLVEVESKEIITTFALYGSTGQVIETGEPGGNRFALNLANYQPGVYILQLNGLNRKKAVKIVKQ